MYFIYINQYWISSFESWEKDTEAINRVQNSSNEERIETDYPADGQEAKDTESSNNDDASIDESATITQKPSSFIDESDFISGENRDDYLPGE